MVTPTHTTHYYNAAVVSSYSYYSYYSYYYCELLKDVPQAP